MWLVQCPPALASSWGSVSLFRDCQCQHGLLLLWSNLMKYRIQQQNQGVKRTVDSMRTKLHILQRPAIANFHTHSFWSRYGWENCKRKGRKWGKKHLEDTACTRFCMCHNSHCPYKATMAKLWGCIVDVVCNPADRTTYKGRPWSIAQDLWINASWCVSS